MTRRGFDAQILRNLRHVRCTRQPSTKCPGVFWKTGVIDLSASGLDELYRHDLSSIEFQIYFAAMKHDLLASKAVAATLIAHVVQSNDSRPDAIDIFGLLLDEARMGIENDSAYGKAFLTNAERAIAAQMATGACGPLHLMRIAALYRRAGLPVPDLLIIDPGEAEIPAEVPVPDLDQALATLATDIKAEGGGPYEFFNGLNEMTAGLTEEMQAGLVHHLASLDDPLFERCALYWLLSGPSLVQQATAAGLHAKLTRTSLQVETLFYLPIIRGWLPAGTARAIVDDIGQLARRKGLFGAPGRDKVESLVGDIMASVTDGAGAQSIAMVGKRNKQTFVAMILLKTGYGIKDAFVIRCRSKREASSIVSYTRQEANSLRIDRMTAELLLEAALADGLGNGSMPVPGFIDVMEACDLNGLRPQERDLQALLDYADPQREVQTATPVQLDLMLNDDQALDALLPLIDSWFEDTGETRTIMRRSRSARTAETKIWAFLDGRRDIWARRFLQTAMILRSAKKKDQSKTLTAAAFALMQKHPLQDIPLMEDIVFTTLAAGGAHL